MNTALNQPVEPVRLPGFGFLSPGSFKRQIVLAFVFGFFLLISAYSAYQVRTERAYLYRDSTVDALSLARSLSASSRSWVLANDVVGLEEVIHSFDGQRGLRYTMIISPQGRVVAHSDASRVGLYLTDQTSLGLIASAPENRILMDSDSVIDVAVPIMIDQRHVGWARVSRGREDIASNLNKMMLSSVFFVLAAVGFSILAAGLIADRLGRRIGSLVRVAEEVQSGEVASRAYISGKDEIAVLAASLNHMLDVLAQDESRLRKASLHARRLIEASLDPLVTISAEGKITDVNRATERVTGRDRGVLIGTDFSDYFTEPDRARSGYQQVFADGFVTDYSLGLRHSDGHITDVLYNASVYRDEDGAVLGVFAAARDVTELKAVEDKVAELNRDLELRVAERTTQLEAANKELEAFSYSVSHDLRTPLRAIDGFSRILLDDYADKLDDEGKRLLGVVRDNTGRMGQLIDDILKFSRTGRVELSFSKMDMSRLAHEVVAELLPEPGAYQLEIDDLPGAYCDAAMMRQVFVNLLSNAIKFSRDKDVPSIKVGSYTEGREQVYFVKDNGAGFDMQYAAKLFGVFQRLHGVTEFEGTGIGLAIVKRIIGRHNGRVWAEGRVGEGATLYFSLPIKEV